MLKEDKEFAINGKQKDRQGLRRDKCSFRHIEDKRAKPTPKNRSTLNHQHKEVEERRRKRSSEARVHQGSSLDSPCKDYLKGICTKSPCDHWHLPNVNSINLNRDANSVTRGRLHTGRLKVNLAKNRKKW